MFSPLLGILPLCLPCSNDRFYPLANGGKAFFKHCELLLAAQVTRAGLELSLKWTRFVCGQLQAESSGIVFFSTHQLCLDRPQLILHRVLVH